MAQHHPFDNLRAGDHAHTHPHSRSGAHEGMPKMPSWLSVEEALERILANVPVLEPEERPLLEALGAVLAEDVRSPLDVPPAANTSMDGYALRWESIDRASRSNPATVRVTGYLAAGSVSKQRVGPGEAIRIMTGAPIPEGANAVVPFEDTDELEQIARGQRVGDAVQVYRAASLGDNIRPAGEDFRKGDLLLEKGAVLRPGEIGVLASIGRTRVKVIRRPVVAILATGDELAEPPAELKPGQIYDSNSYGLAAAVLRYGGVPKMLGIAKDTLESLEAKVKEGMQADLLLTSAGVSRGDYDIVKDVLAKQGDINFWTVRMRPAKPLAFGVLRPWGSKLPARRPPETRPPSPGRTGELLPGPGTGRPSPEEGGWEGAVPHLGLPGNPVSAMVAFEEFARPAILKMQGRRSWAKPTVQAVLEEPIHNTDGRRVYARVWVEKRDGRYYARLTGPQGSGILTSVARANGLAICPDDVEVKKAGETVDVQMLDWLEEQG